MEGSVFGGQWKNVPRLSVSCPEISTSEWSPVSAGPPWPGASSAARHRPAPSPTACPGSSDAEHLSVLPQRAKQGLSLLEQHHGEKLWPCGGGRGGVRRGAGGVQGCCSKPRDLEQDGLARSKFPKQIQQVECPRGTLGLGGATLGPTLPASHRRARLLFLEQQLY